MADHVQPSQRIPSSAWSFDSIGVKNRIISETSGVSLNPQQKLMLFEGLPTLKHLSLWNPQGTFQDPIALAQGYDQFAAQWYGLPALFSPISIQSHKVISSDNPIKLELSNKYVVRGIGKEQVMKSIVQIELGADGRIDKVEDRWNDKLPEGSVAETFRTLNARTVPRIVKVPETEEEDKQLQEERARAV